MKVNTYDFTIVYPVTNCRMQSPFVKGGQGDLNIICNINSVLQINSPPVPIAIGTRERSDSGNNN